jgi:hypothetical protein
MSCYKTLKAGNSYCWGNLSTVDLLIKLARFVKKEKYLFSLKAANLNLLIQRGQSYLSFPFSKDSLLKMKFWTGQVDLSLILLFDKTAS